VSATLIGGLFRTPDGKIDYAHDFFSEPTFLTVSGQLNVETYACAMTSVYTFGPTFRAENSNTTRHLAEFWMIEVGLHYTSGMQFTLSLKVPGFIPPLNMYVMCVCVT
jgi:aspartyl/asparaginyl-tRNA synthetase